MTIQKDVVRAVSLFKDETRSVLTIHTYDGEHLFKRFSTELLNDQSRDFVITLKNASGELLMHSYRRRFSAWGTTARDFDQLLKEEGIQ